MIIYYLYVVSISFTPSKANSPLVIYANAVFTFSVSLKFLKAVARWNL